MLIGKIEIIEKIQASDKEEIRGFDFVNGKFETVYQDNSDKPKEKECYGNTLYMVNSWPFLDPCNQHNARFFVKTMQAAHNWLKKLESKREHENNSKE